MNRNIIAAVILFVGVLSVSQAAGQKRPKLFGILQGTFTKYNSDVDGSLGGSLSGGILLRKQFGVGLNFQAYERYKPLSFEASYFTTKKFSPYFNLQLGKGFYKYTSTYSAPGFTSKDQTTGGYYFSPGAGILLPCFRQTKIIVTAAYIRSQFKRELSIVGDPTRLDQTSIRNGFKVGLGVKI